jgi:hypothetical protein
MKPVVKVSNTGIKLGAQSKSPAFKETVEEDYEPMTIRSYTERDWIILDGSLD